MVRVVHFVNFHVFTILVPCCDDQYDVRRTICSCRLFPHCFYSGFLFYLCYLYLLMYICVWHAFHIRCGVNTTGVTIGAGTVYLSRASEFIQGFYLVSGTQSLVFCVDLLFTIVCFSVLFSSGHCIVFLPFALDFRLLLRYLQTFLEADK